MFLDESDFDIEDTNEAPRRTGNYRDRDRETASRGNTGGYGSRPATSQSQSLAVSLSEFEDDDMGDLSAALGSAGGLGTPSSSRARMLAQQREIQLKKRQNNIQSGMIRSSVDSSVDKSAQFTPAVRQFSAPKAAARDYTDYETSDFTRPARAPAAAPRGGWDLPDEDPEPRYQSPKDPYREPRDRDSRDNARRAPPREAPRHRDYDDEDDYRGNGREYRGGRREPPPQGRRGGYDDYYEEEPVRRPRPAGQREWRSSGPRGRDEEDDYREPERHHREPPQARRPKRYEDEDEYEDSYRRDEDSYRRAPPREPRGEDWDDDRPAASRRGGKHNRRRTDEEDEDEEVSRERWGSADRGGKKNRQGNAPTPIPKEVPAERLDLSNMQRFLTTPVPKRAGIVQCYIRRNRSGTHKLFPIYSLYLKEDDVFLFCSKKRPNNKTSNYLISKVEGELNRESDSYMGKLRSNFMGTEFQVFDNGANPSAADGGRGRDVRRELGAVMYAPNVLGSRGPRKMQVAIPAVDENNQIVTWKQTQNSPDGEILQRMKDRNFRDLIYLINKPPRWNEQVGAYVLNFSGRVTMASVKNFQLVDPDEQNAVLLQFGRVGKDEFTMDMQWPLSPFQAFAITLSSFDSKIACD